PRFAVLVGLDQVRMAKRRHPEEFAPRAPAEMRGRTALAEGLDRHQPLVDEIEGAIDGRARSSSRQPREEPPAIDGFVRQRPDHGRLFTPRPSVATRREARSVGPHRYENLSGVKRPPL